LVGGHVVGPKLRGIAPYSLLASPPSEPPRPEVPL
jgi:hypothetical protein